MLGAVSGAMDAVSGALGGVAGGPAASNAPLKFYKGENLGQLEQSLAGAQAPEDRRPIDAGAVIEFIHMGYVHLDSSKNFHHDPKKDDIVETFPNNAKLRAFQFRAALHREALLLSCMITGCQSVLDALEKTQGGVGEMVGMAANMLGAGGAGDAKPKAGDLNAMGKAIQTAIAKINTASTTYKDLHQVGIDLHQVRCNYRAFQQKLLEPPKNDPGGGLLGKLPVVGGAIPSSVSDILNFVTGLAFKPMDVYQHFYVRIALDMEPLIEATVNSYSVDALKGPITPAFYLWYPAPPAPDPAAAGDDSGGGGTGLSFIDDAKKRLDELKSKVEDYGKKIRDFVEPDPDQPPCPGEPYLDRAFKIPAGAPPAAAGAAPPAAPPPAPSFAPPKELSNLVLSGFKAGLGSSGLPGFVETVIIEVTAVNNEFLRAVYKKLMERPAVQPINELEVYEAARKMMLDRLINIVMDKISFLKSAKDFGMNVQGTNVKPGEALLDEGVDELNQEVLRRLNVALELTMGELVDKLEGLRQQCGKANAIAMEAYLGVFPWLLALNFRNTFMPVWQLIMDNTFGKASGPVGNVVHQARDAMNKAKSKVDDARTVAMRLQRIKDRADREGVSAGLSGQNLVGYQKDWAADLPPDQVQPKPATVPFFPFTKRLVESAGEKVTKTEYDNVKGSNKWDSAGAPPQV